MSDPHEPRYARSAIDPRHVYVLALLAKHPAASDSSLTRKWAARAARGTHPWPFVSDSTIRSCRADLVRWGVLQRAEAIATTRYNRATSTWELAPSKRPIPVRITTAGIAALNTEADVARETGDLITLSVLSDIAFRASA
jgi:hypothetical protein